MPSISEVLDRHREDLLAVPGCTAVAIGKKTMAGRQTDTDCIVVFVRSKGRPEEPGTGIPAQLDGIPTDVVEREFGFDLAYTDPMQRRDPVFSGISVTRKARKEAYGTIGCFIKADGAVPPVSAGYYLLTNHHVAAGDPGDLAIQPGGVTGNIPDEYTLGTYRAGIRDASHDCAVVDLENWRGFRNEVPGPSGNRTLQGIGTVKVRDTVYKFGATSRHTTGLVTNTNWSGTLRDGYRITDAILISSESSGRWMELGDSGSVAVRQADDLALGLNFAASETGEGLAYDISTQISVFSGEIKLA